MDTLASISNSPDMQKFSKKLKEEGGKKQKQALKTRH